jgi:hypothetical protein
LVLLIAPFCSGDAGFWFALTFRRLPTGKVRA